MDNIRNRSRLKKLRKILHKVNSYAGSMKEMEDSALQAKTAEFRERLRQGETMDQLLPEAYAVVREASGRVLGMYPYDTQVLGGITLHQGRIAEMKTGEGKTLVASMPLYLNALTGKGCILVTTNSYLAVRDGTQLGALFRFLDINLEIGVSDDPGRRLTAKEKKRIYSADIVYTTNAALGFDYLLENLAISPEEQYLRDFYYVIIDEADEVLLDSAQTPLVVSGAPRVQSNLYETADYFVSLLKEGRDFETEEKNVWLTEEGIRRAERYFCLEDLYAPNQFETVRHIYLALKARIAFQRDRQYVVENHKVDLLDSRTGRILRDTKLRAGQHQALEAKEHVPITQESRAMASVTYQSLFNMFEKKAGMTGTGVGDEEEFREIYGLDVVVIPTNRKMLRKDYPDQYFTTIQAEIHAAMEELVRVHASGQPVLMITGSIDMSSAVSEMLLQAGIPHNVLNAYNTAKEAEIIKEAGQKNAVTVATSVAGRGTDIRLGKGVPELGGLVVLGVGRMENRRQELQARGRSGRQGDPGYSRFYASLEDDVVTRYGSEYLEKYRAEDRRIRSFRLIRQINLAQRICEEQGAGARRSTMEFGESMVQQRSLVYSLRRRIMRSEEPEPELLLQMEADIIDDFLSSDPLPDAAGIMRFILDHLSYRMNQRLPEEKLTSREEIRTYLLELAGDCLGQKMASIPEKELRVQFYHMMTLRAIDDAWIEEVDYLQQLRTSIMDRRYTQHNVMFEYHREAYFSFQKMEKRMKKETMRNILLGELVRRKDGSVQVLMP